MIRSAIDQFERRDSGVRAVLVRALGADFCSGADLEDASSMARDPRATDDYLELVQTTLRRLESSPLPVVAACQGLVLAGGLELALCCDVVLAADDAHFGDQHVNYGPVPAWGASQRLPRAVGLQRALHLMFSGARISAADAAQWGLVSRVVPSADLADEAMLYCEQLATRSPSGLDTMKRLARAAEQLPLDVGLELERAAVVRRLDGPDPAEGLAAFQEGRVPLF
jgi:enoyl-CoA hydratase